MYYLCGQKHLNLFLKPAVETGVIAIAPPERCSSLLVILQPAPKAGCLAMKLSAYVVKLNATTLSASDKLRL